MRQPVPNTQIITVKNMDKEALAIESDYKNKQYLEVFLSTGQVILPYQTQRNNLKFQYNLFQEIMLNIKI